MFTASQNVLQKASGNFYTLPNELKKDFPKLKPILSKKNDSKHYGTFIFDKKGEIWSWGGNYIYKVDKKSKKIVEKFDFKKLSGKGFQKLYFDNKNRLWVSTWENGVFIFNTKTKKLDRVETVFNNKFVALGFINWKHQGKNYIVVLGDASLVLIDEETLNVKMYEDLEGRFRVYDAMQDKQGNLWLATVYGLKFINSKQNFAEVIPIINSNDFKNKFQKAVTSIYKGENNFIVAKRWFDGVYIYDKNWKLKQHIPQFETRKTSQINGDSAEVLDIISIGENKYFAGYYGLYKLNKIGKIKLIVPKGFKENEELFLGEIKAESNTVWWVKYKGGILKFNPQKDEFFENYDLNVDKNQAFEIHSIILT